MNKSIVFDSSSVISLAMNDLLWLLKSLKEKFKGDFIIPKSVKEELVDKPLKSKKYKFEALMIMNLIKEGTINIYNKSKEHELSNLLNLTNSIFEAKNEKIKILHKGEVDSLITVLDTDAESIVIDERTTRLLIEDPNKLKKILENKLHTKIKVNNNKLKEFRKKTRKIRVIRSTELAMIAYEMNLFKNYINLKNVKDIRKELIEGLLWGLKLRGCSISNEEINQLIKIER